MKKILSLFLVIALCIGLCACGSNDNTDTIANLENRIAELEKLLADRDAEIDRLVEELNRPGEEPEDTPPYIEPEETEPENTEPENTEPKYEVVEITVDNWQDYFEVKAYPHIVRNGFGELDMLWVTSYFITKEDINIVDNNITCEYTLDYKEVPYHVDLENDTVIFGDEPEEIDSKIQEVATLESMTIYEKNRCGACLFNLPCDRMDGEVGMAFNFKIIRIQGMITIAE